MDRSPPPDPANLPSDWQVLTEEAIGLIHRSQAGDRWAFADLQRRFFTPVLKFARVRFWDLRDAEDATMEIFVNLYRALPSLSDPGRFVGFLFGIARHICNDRWRRLQHRRWEEVPLDDVIAQEEEMPELPSLVLPGADEAFRQQETRREIERAISRLAPPFREALLLYYQEEQSYEQIAQMLEVSVETVRHRVRRARRRLADILPAELQS